jgi:tetratricopeptide (TPR) repeat protein
VQRGLEQEQDYVRIWEISKAAYGPDNAKTIKAVASLGNLYVEEGKYAAALPLLQRSLEMERNKTPLERESSAGRMGNEAQLALAYIGIGKYPEAEDSYQRALTLMETGPSDPLRDSIRLAREWRDLCRVYRYERRYDDALDAVKRAGVLNQKAAESKFRKSSWDRSLWTWLNESELAEIYREKGDIAVAEPIFQRSVATAQNVGGAKRARAGIQQARSTAEQLRNYASR